MTNALLIFGVAAPFAIVATAAPFLIVDYLRMRRAARAAQTARAQKKATAVEWARRYSQAARDGHAPIIDPSGASEQEAWLREIVRDEIDADNALRMSRDAFEFDQMYRREISFRPNLEQKRKGVRADG